jgi:hypothetical protein
VQDSRGRLIIVSRGERDILRSVLHAADQWPPTTAVMLDRRGDDRRAVLRQVMVDRRRQQRRRTPEGIWYSHRFMVVKIDAFPVQAVMLSPPESSEGPW